MLSWGREVKVLAKFRRQTPKRVPNFCRVGQNACSKGYHRKHQPVYLQWANFHHEVIRTFVYFAKDRPCADGVKKYPHYVMDVNHREGETRPFTISSVLRGQWRSVRTVVAEIAKNYRPKLRRHRRNVCAVCTGEMPVPTVLASSSKCAVVCANRHRIVAPQRYQCRPEKTEL